MTETVALLVEQGHQEGLARQQLLELAVDGVTQGRVELAAPALAQAVDLAPAAHRRQDALARMQQTGDEGVGVGIVGEPAQADHVGLAQRRRPGEVGDRGG